VTIPTPDSWERSKRPYHDWDSKRLEQAMRVYMERVKTVEPRVRMAMELKIQQMQAEFFWREKEVNAC
jgi:hypothetical protein